jgi:hypothetical protein
VLFGLALAAEVLDRRHVGEDLTAERVDGALVRDPVALKLGELPPTPIRVLQSCDPASTPRRLTRRLKAGRASEAVCVMR